MKWKLLLKCFITSALGLLIGLAISLSVITVIYGLALADIFEGIMKYSIGIAITYLIMVPLVYFEQIKKHNKDD